MNPWLIPARHRDSLETSARPTSFLSIGYRPFLLSKSLTSQRSSTCCCRDADSSLLFHGVSSLYRRFVAVFPWVRSISRSGPNGGPFDWKSAACREGNSSRNVSTTCTLKSIGRFVIWKLYKSVKEISKISIIFLSSSCPYKNCSTSEIINLYKQQNISNTIWMKENKN